MQNNISEIVSRFNSMREQEERMLKCHDYTSGGTGTIDDECRKAMADWCFKVVDALSLSRETVGIAMSFLDRYLSSGKGKSSEALGDRHKFQLTAITAFYIAVKMYEPVEMGVDLLVKLCRGFYADKDIIPLEQDILFALEWRVSGPTPLDFVRHLLQMHPQSGNGSVSDCILENAQKHMDYVATKIYFSTCKPSAIGAGCLINSLSETNILSPLEKEDFLSQISNLANYNIFSAEVLEVQKSLSSQSPFCAPIVGSKVATLSRSNSISSHKVDSFSSSPVCIAQTGIQA